MESSTVSLEATAACSNANNTEPTLTMDHPTKDEELTASSPPNGTRATEPGPTKPPPTTEASSKPAWDHSNRKVLVNKVPKYGNQNQMRKLVNEWLAEIATPIRVQRIKKPPKDSWMIVIVEEESMADPLIDYINSNEFTNKHGERLQAKRAEGFEQKKHNRDDDDEDRVTKRHKREADIMAQERALTEDEVRDKITPLWRESAEEQISTKERALIHKMAVKLIKEVKLRFKKLDRDKNRHGKSNKVYDWLNQDRAIDVAPMIPVPSPVRNKCEFTFGYRYLFDGTDRDKSVPPPSVPGVGFMAAGWAGGVSSPHCCANIPEEACAVVDIVNDFLKDSPLPPYDSKVHQGIWKLLTVRSSRRTKECMIVVTHAPATGGVGEEDHLYQDHFESEKARLLSKLTTVKLPVTGHEPLSVTSVFFQEHDGMSVPTPDDPVQHVYGKLALTEQLGKCSFQISPGAFFQVNTPGAEILYQKVVERVREVSEDPAKTLLFDVCCGTGTIGLTCMKEGVVGQVVGVDISVPAIKDAEKNAELNGFADPSKVRFVAGKAEGVLAREIATADKESDYKFIAVVDPAREGLHHDVVRCMRANRRIDRIIYVSCNPTGTLVRDGTLLCSPPTKRYLGRAFKVTSVVPVDMFPLTQHAEVVMVFDRLGADEVE